MNTAMNQTQLRELQSEVQVEFKATQQKIADLEAKKAELQQLLYRYGIHQKLLAERTIPKYAPWLPFSKQA
jgi:hypothetical protein